MRYHDPTWTNRGRFMKGQRIGYKRVSTFDQNEERQLAGLELDRIFIDKASGKDTNRPQFIEMMRFAREGDRIVVHSMDRLARNLDDLRKIVKDAISKGIEIEFVKESLTFDSQASPMSNLLLSVMGAFAEFERALIKERQKEGIALAKMRGVYKGRKRSLQQNQIEELKLRAANHENKSALAKEYGISRQTLYSYLEEHN